MGFTTPNWPDLDSFIHRATDISPIRFFDENKITPGSVYSHIIALELFHGNEITRLEDADYSLLHISLTFAVECDEKDIVLFNDIHAHKITRSNKVNRRETFYILMTMTLREWKEAVVRYSSQRYEQYLRQLFNDFYDLLAQANLGELFNDYVVTQLSDGTFSLR